MTRIRLEAASVAITLLGMVGGWIAGRAGLGPAANAGYALAYVAGGWAGAAAAWTALRAGHVDIDLLMILAALGAAFIGAPFEGAMLPLPLAVVGHEGSTVLVSLNGLRLLAAKPE